MSIVCVFQAACELHPLESGWSVCSHLARVLLCLDSSMLSLPGLGCFFFTSGNLARPWLAVQVCREDLGMIILIQQSYHVSCTSGVILVIKVLIAIIVPDVYWSTPYTCTSCSCDMYHMRHLPYVVHLHALYILLAHLGVLAFSSFSLFMSGSLFLWYIIDSSQRVLNSTHNPLSHHLNIELKGQVYECELAQTCQ